VAGTWIRIWGSDMDQDIAETVDQAVQSIADRLIQLGMERAANLVATAAHTGAVPPVALSARERKSLPKSSRTAPGTDDLDRLIIRMIRMHPGESLAQVYRRGRFPLSYSSVQTRAQWLRSCGLLRTEGATSRARWHLVGDPPPDARPAPEPPEAAPQVEAEAEAEPTPDVVSTIRAYLEAHPEGVPPGELLASISGLTRTAAVRLCSSLVARGTIRASQARGLTLYTLGVES
jgi:hypothetical protein